MKFTITAGHSNRDPGAVGQGTTEAEVVVDMRNILAGKLRALGHTVFTDGEGSVNLELREAIKLIDKSDVAIELHCNASLNFKATGVEVIGLDKDRVLCQRLANAVATTLRQKTRGDNGYISQSQSALGKLGYVSAGGIILEMYFLSNAADHMFYQVNKDKVANAIVHVLTTTYSNPAPLPVL